jgi:signal transduction histidine kinase
MIRFAAAGVVALAVLAAVIALLSRQAGTQQAIETAREVTWVSATGIAEPRLTDEVVAGNPGAVQAFHADMEQYVIQGSLVRIKVWSASGRVVYATESRLIGRTFPLNEEHQAALRERRIASEVSDLTSAENIYEIPFEKLLEVYVGVASPSGQPLLFEAYFRYDAVAETGQAQWRQFAPPVLGGLVILQLVQLPAAWSLATRVRRQEAQAQGLLRAAVDSSNAERRRIAADLHDGLVQGLVGMTYALDAARLGQVDPERDRGLIASTAGGIRNSIAQLRALLVDIYPPNLSAEGLSAALYELGEEVVGTGIQVEWELAPEIDRLSPALSGVLYRAAQETLRNVTRHSRATTVRISVLIGPEVTSLAVDDDGQGFDEQRLESRVEQGHVGLRSLADLIENAHGQLTLTSAPGAGTRTQVSLATKFVEEKP